MQTHQRPRIALFNVTRDLGGTEKVIFDLAAFLDPEKVDLSLWGSPEFLGWVPQSLSAIPKVEMDIAHKLDVGAVRRMAVKLRQQRIDLVHAHQFRPGFFAAMAGFPVRVPVIYTQHVRETWRKGFFIDRASSRFTARIIAVSDAIGDFLVNEKRIAPNRIAVIKNGVDIDKYKGGNREKFRQASGFSDREFVIGLVGRLHEQKGHTFLIRALELTGDQAPGLHALFIGGGPLEAELKNQVVQSGLRETVTFLGFRDDVHEILPGLDLLVLPSLFEGLPLTVLEAGAAGIPVLATRVDGTVEVIRDGKTGWLVEPGNPKALEGAIIQAARRPDLRKLYADNLHELVVGEHSFQAVARRHEALYFEVLGMSARGVEA